MGNITLKARIAMEAYSLLGEAVSRLEEAYALNMYEDTGYGGVELQGAVWDVVDAMDDTLIQRFYEGWDAAYLSYTVGMTVSDTMLKRFDVVQGNAMCYGFDDVHELVNHAMREELQDTPTMWSGVK